MKESGFKISLEGIDGVGKTTQISTLQEHLAERGYDVMYKPCRNNAQSNGLDGRILDILKGSDRELHEAPATEMLLAAARLSYVHKRKAAGHLALGGVVLSDRDIDSTVAYGLSSLSRQHQERSRTELIRWTMGLYALDCSITPDLTLWLDTDVQTALGRAMSDEVPNERAIFSSEGVSYIEEVRSVYSELHGLYPDRIHKVDVGAKTIDQVGGELVSAVDEFIDGERR